jgi:hypothetical protein
MKAVSYNRLLYPIAFFVFLPISCTLFFTKGIIESKGLDFWVLFLGNLLLFIITAIALFFHQKGVQHANPNVFFRTVYGSMILRMFFCIILVVFYALLSGDRLNKFSLLLCFAFYFLYSFLEVRRVFSLLKNKD